MEFDEHENQEEEEMEIPTPPPGYESLVGHGHGNSVRTPKARYKECQKNHAMSIGGVAVDGCGEFMAAGEEGTLDALKCAACNCHRNFHRKETEGSSEALYRHQHQHHQFAYYRAAPPQKAAGYLHVAPSSQHRPLAMEPTSGGSDGGHYGEEMSNPSSSGGGGGGSMVKKRFRTKFTQEQREKLLAFAESLGWRIQKHDEAAVEQFCEDTGVKRHVLKVWMHNNKHTLGKKP